MNVVQGIREIDSTTRSALLTHTSPVSIASYEHEQDLGLMEYLATADVEGRELSE